MSIVTIHALPDFGLPLNLLIFFQCPPDVLLVLISYFFFLNFDYLIYFTYFSGTYFLTTLCRYEVEIWGYF